MHVKLRKSEGVEFFNNISAGNAFLMVFFSMLAEKERHLRRARHNTGRPQSSIYLARLYLVYEYNVVQCVSERRTRYSVD